MNRRAFLSTLIGTGLAAAIDPERLLWTPGAKTIFIPKPCGPVTLEEILRGKDLFDVETWNHIEIDDIEHGWVFTEEIGKIDTVRFFTANDFSSLRH